MTKKTINDFQVGNSASFTKTITEADILMFGAVSGDFNPAHFDEEYAKTTQFKSRIAHGMITASLLSGVMGMQLPGPGTIYMKQELKFMAPVYAGNTVTAKVEVIEVILEKGRLRLKTTCTNQEGKVVVDGEALVMAPR
jgi:3-hydroxybutyryl-CoA dehydratase